MTAAPFALAWRPLTPDTLERLCILTRTHHWVPLARVWKAGRLRTVVVVGRDFFPPARIYDAAATPGPAVIVIAGDGDPPLSPGEVPHVRRAIAWATHVAIHATGAQAWHYEMIAETAAGDRARVLLIETCTRHRDAWVAEVRRFAASNASALLVDVPPGAPPHPLPKVLH